MIIKTENVGVTRPRGPALDFADFSMARGEMLLLLGSSGSGKTSLLSVLAGFLRPTTGQVLVDGQDLYAMSAADRDALRGQKMGFVFQTLHLLPSLTIIDNVLLAARMAGRDADRGRAAMLLQSVGLQGKEMRKPFELSQGEQQRAAIARAVINNPDIIIADEPTSALDDDNARMIMDLLEGQALASGAALLIATHDARIRERFSRTMTLAQTLTVAA